jgi:predicted XRE-type DNA-binding protein
MELADGFAPAWRSIFQNDFRNRACSRLASRLREEEPEDSSDRSGDSETAQAPVQLIEARHIMTRKRANVHVGTDFEDFLRDEGTLEEATALAVKRVLAWELQKAMKKSDMSISELARRMKTSRAVVHRLLDEQDQSVTLATISRAAAVLGRTIQLRLAA